MPCCVTLSHKTPVKLLFVPPIFYLFIYFFVILALKAEYVWTFFFFICALQRNSVGPTLLLYPTSTKSQENNHISNLYFWFTLAPHRKLTLTKQKAKVCMHLSPHGIKQVMQRRILHCPGETSSVWGDKERHTSTLYGFVWRQMLTESGL